MSLNHAKQNEVNILLTTDFKKQYELIPAEFKHNYYFEKFLFHMAEINTAVENTKKRSAKHPDWNVYFKTTKTENAMSTAIECTIFEDDAVNKQKMIVTLEKNGILKFSWIFAFVWEKGNYIPERDDAIYELTMKLSDNKSKVFVEHTTTHNGDDPYKCHMSSIFDTNIKELCRVAEAINPQTNEILFQEEFIPIGIVDSEYLKEWRKKGEQKPIQLLNIHDNNSTLNQLHHHQNTKEIFVGKCTIGENTRYALCWKRNCFVNEAYQETFESISSFGTPGLNLSYTLDTTEIPTLIEISEEEYNALIGKASKIPTPQLTKVLK